MTTDKLLIRKLKIYYSKLDKHDSKLDNSTALIEKNDSSESKFKIISRKDGLIKDLGS